MPDVELGKTVPRREQPVSRLSGRRACAALKSRVKSSTKLGGAQSAQLLFSGFHPRLLSPGSQGLCLSEASPSSLFNVLILCYSKNLRCFSLDYRFQCLIIYAFKNCSQSFMYVYFLTYHIDGKFFDEKNPNFIFFESLEGSA
jgi:hypothetical protein